MTRHRRRNELNHGWGRTLAATLGTVPLALSLGVALTLWLPVSPAMRLLIGGYSVFPVWVAAACLVFLAPSGLRAWGAVLGVTLLACSLSALALARGHAAASWVSG